MDDSDPIRPTLAGSAGRFSRRLLDLGANRLALLDIELQEARDETLGALVLILGAAVCALLSITSLTAAIVVVFWRTSPVGVLLGLAVLYGAGAVFVFGRFAARQRRWKMFPETMAELRKDRDCLEKFFL